MYSENFVLEPSDKSQRRKAVLTVRHIFPPNDTTEPDHPFVFTVQPTAKNNFVFPEIVKCSSSHIAYHEEVSSNQTRVTGLQFLLIGHNLNQDFSAYSCCVTSVEFHGHLSYSKPIFQIFSQLSSLKKVEFIVGSPSQLPFFNEPKDDDITTVSQNVNVEYLAIRADIWNYKRSPTCKKSFFQDIMLSVLERSGHCFPNLKDFYMELPCTGKLSKLTEELIATKWNCLTGQLVTSYCPFAESLFVVPFRAEEAGSGNSNNLDLELLDILIGRQYSAHSRYTGGVTLPTCCPDARNSVYYRANYERYFPIERPSTAHVPVRSRLNELLEEGARQERMLQRLRRRNVLNGTDNNNQERQQRNFVYRRNPGTLPAMDFFQQFDSFYPRRIHPLPFPFHQQFRYDENDDRDREDVV